MVHEIKKGIENGSVLFGIKQSLKNSAGLQRALVSSDCRDEIIRALQEKKIEVEVLEFAKEDLTNKLELDFQCEVFGLKK